MSIMEKAGSAALDLAKNEGIQNKAMDLFGMLCPYLSIRKKAIDLYVDEIEKSDLSADAKVVALLNAKQTIKKLKPYANDIYTFPYFCVFRMKEYLSKKKL